MGSTSFWPVSSSIMFGWEQQVLVQARGKVFLSDDRLWKRSWFWELKRKMLNARWGMELGSARYLCV